MTVSYLLSRETDTQHSASIQCILPVKPKFRSMGRYLTATGHSPSTQRLINTPHTQQTAAYVHLSNLLLTSAQRLGHQHHYSPPVLLHALHCTLVVMTGYIQNTDISFSISIYHIISYHRRNYQLFRYIVIFKYIAIFSIFCDNCYRFIATQRDWKERLQMRQVNGVIV